MPESSETCLLDHVPVGRLPGEFKFLGVARKSSHTMSITSTRLAGLSIAGCARSDGPDDAPYLSAFPTGDESGDVSVGGEESMPCG
jgi:hypothetical protein